MVPKQPGPPLPLPQGRPIPGRVWEHQRRASQEVVRQQEDTTRTHQQDTEIHASSVICDCVVNVQ